MKRTFSPFYPAGLFAVLIAGIFCLQSVYAQRMSHSLSLNRGDSFFSFHRRQISSSSPDTVHVLAVMVQFQIDDDSRTTGNGQFDLSSTYQDTVIDAPPHNRTYFQNHLLFLENYFKKVSDVKVIVKSQVLDGIYTLPNKMQTYSPPTGATNEAVGQLMQDTWRLVDSTASGIEFSRYDFFIIFHAGAGHDVDLVSVYGYDPTPFDIPSLYLGLSSLESFFGGDYRGVPVNQGRFFITNSAVLPETESRDIQSAVGTSRLELSINGLLAASLGSFLGLPDLFDTKTGRTGIGKFGLMDGQAIFSFNGLFPPEPSAWEKIFLGWVQPVTVQSGVSDLTIAAHRTDGAANTNVVYRVPISTKEYFLMESRFRDPALNGQRITTVVAGKLIEKVFLTDDTSGFDAVNTTKIDGVVIDVEDMDWSLPGGITDKGDTLRGGILIWHIDENVIETDLATNTVNVDPNHRGVSLMQANGAQDIGQVIYSPFGDYIGEGSALDYWCRENTSPVYKNEFTPTSHPSSESYTHANSHIYVTDFSKQGPVMTCRVQIGDNVVRPLPGFPKRITQFSIPSAPMAGDVDGDGNDEIVILVDEQVFAFRPDGKTLLRDSTGLVIKRALVLPALFDVNGDGKLDIVSGGYYQLGYVTYGNRMKIWTVEDKNNDGEADELLSIDPPAYGNYVSIWNSADGPRLLLGSDNRLFVLSTQGKIEAEHDLSISSLITVGSPDARKAEWIAVGPHTGQSSQLIPWSFAEFQISSAAAGSDIDGDGDPEIVFIAYDGSGFDIVVLERNPTRIYSFPITPQPAGDVIVSPPVLGDIDGDGRRDIVLTVNDKLYAYNFSGHLLDHFPITLPNSSGIDRQYLRRTIVAPVLGDINGDGSLDILVGTPVGQVIAFDRSGNVLEGFPLMTGGTINSTPVLFQTGGKVGLAVTSSDGYLYAWQTSGTYVPNNIAWGSYLRDARHTSFEGSIVSGKPLSAEFLPASRAYNWPNPVYEGKTKIRYYVGSSAAVSIKIFDLAGEKVDEISAQGIGGIDNEVEWSVSNIQSGVYIARIEATGNGASGVAFIKIAVVH